jgi:hypothetical protein
MKYYSLFIACLLKIIIFSQVNEILDYDGHLYPVIEYNGYLFMTENLNTAHFKNGDEIIESKSKSEWVKNCKNSVPTFMINKEFPELGFMYNGFAVFDSRGLLPEDYIIPTDSIYFGDIWQNNNLDIKIRNDFKNQFIGDIYKESNAFDKNCSKSKSFYIQPDGKVYQSPCTGGRWWMIETHNPHTDNSFSTSCCTGYDGAHHGDYTKEDWESWGFYVRGVKLVK